MKSAPSCFSPARGLLWLLTILALGLSPLETGAQPIQVENPGDLAALADQQEFTPLDDSRLAAAAEQLRTAIGGLQRSPDLADREQLQWLGLPADASAPLEPVLQDAARLNQIQSQLEQDFEPLEQSRYQQLRSAIELYRRTLTARAEPDLVEQFHGRRQRVRDELARWLATGDLASHAAIARQIVWFDEHLQAAELVAALRQRLSHPNLILTMPAGSLALISRQSIELDQPVSRQSGQLRTSGRSQLSGQVRLMPSGGEAPLRLEFPGSLTLTTTSWLGPFHFRSEGRTALEASQGLDWTFHGLRLASEPQVTARTVLRNGPVQTRRHGPLPHTAARLADRLVARRSAEAAGAISHAAREELRAEFSRRAAEQLAEFNRQFASSITDSAVRLQLQPRQWHTAADQSAFTVRVTQDRHSGLAAPRPCPDDARSDLPALTVHETFAADVLNSVYRGQNWPRDLDANGLQSFNDQLPVPLFEHRDFLPRTSLHVRLHERRPFELRFDRDRIQLVLRAERMRLDERELSGVALTLDFRLVAERRQIVLLREGEPRLEFTDDRTADQDLLERFTLACRQELLGAMKREVTIPAVLEQAGWTVWPERFESRPGWFTVLARVEPARPAQSPGDDRR
ncbi:MAG: hypothetical protein J5I93_12205 [Pirellulaceae bacterium]|nr:hypothetical protein [Pirellulaceae bacterium]